MSRPDEFKQHMEFTLDVENIKQGDALEDDVIGGVKLNATGQLLVAGISLSSTSIMLFTIFLFFELALMSLIVTALLVVWFFWNLKQQKSEIDAVREEQLRNFRMKKGDARYWGRREG